MVVCHGTTGMRSKSYNANRSFDTSWYERVVSDWQCCLEPAAAFDATVGCRRYQPRQCARAYRLERYGVSHSVVSCAGWCGQFVPVPVGLHVRRTIATLATARSRSVDLPTTYASRI